MSKRHERFVASDAGTFTVRSKAAEETEIREVEVHRSGKTFKRRQKVRVDTANVPKKHHGKLTRTAKRALRFAQEKAVQLTPAALKVASALGAVFDTPADMKKFGYNPTTSSGTANAGHDPVKQNLADVFGVGVNGHIVASAVAYVLSHAVTWAKRKLRDGREDADPGIQEFAEFLASVYAHVIKELGGDESNAPTAEAIAENIAALLA